MLALSLLALPVGAAGQSSDQAAAGDNEAAAPVHVTWTGTAVDGFDVPGEPEPLPWGGD